MTWEARIKEALLASSEDLSAGEGLLLWPGEWMVQRLADQFGMAVRVWSEQLDSTLKYLGSYRLEYALVPEGSKVEGFSSLAVQDIPLTLSCIVTTTHTLTPTLTLTLTRTLTLTLTLTLTQAHSSLLNLSMCRIL